ncbi:MAG: hypothetical protein J6O40_03825 [Ruminococcus sp.]|nr:hypothetical protein [Ruminococcus sp.]
MGLLSALFGNEKKQKPIEEEMLTAEEKPSTRKKSFPLGEFTFVDCATCDPPEFGYEGEIEWFDMPDSDDPYERLLGVYIDRDTVDSYEADLCYRKLEEYAADKRGFERKVKQAAAEHFLNERSDLFFDKRPNDAAELADGFELRYISIYRNGDTVFSLEQYASLAIEGDVYVTFKADGSVKFRYTEG